MKNTPNGEKILAVNAARFFKVCLTILRCFVLSWFHSPWSGSNKSILIVFSDFQKFLDVSGLSKSWNIDWTDLRFGEALSNEKSIHDSTIKFYGCIRSAFLSEIRLNLNQCSISFRGLFIWKKVVSEFLERTESFQLFAKHPKKLVFVIHNEKWLD